jgi:hypothetical protein
MDFRQLIGWHLSCTLNIDEAIIIKVTTQPMGGGVVQKNGLNNNMQGWLSSYE